jgi:ABC-type transport system involved in cytochrome bd biosynthesis fused ATPase/permease subunit
MSADDVLLRQLKFSFVLQVIGAALFAIATVIRFIAGGFDLTTIVFLGATILILVAAFFTRTRIQQLRDS